jgi:hypothetical protein
MSHSDDYDNDNYSYYSDYDELNVIVATASRPEDEAAKPKYKFQIYRRSDFGKPPGVEWAVQGLLVRRGISLIYGEPKTGKSLLMQSIACVAAAEYTSEDQRTWCGYPACKMKILYVAAEGFPGLMGRHDCFKQINGVRINDENFRYLRRPINYFINDGDWKQAALDLKAQKFCPDYIITDTLARSVLGGDERSEKDMAKVFTNAEGFCEEMNGAGMGLIGHATKDGTNYRGSPAIYAMVDGLSEVTRKGLAITWTCRDFKDAEPFEPVTVRCESAEVDTEMGPQRVIQVKTAEGAEAARRPVREDRLDEAMELMRAVLVDRLGNSAVSGRWRTEMHEVAGWGDTKFDEMLKEFKNRHPELTGGRWQNDPYSLDGAAGQGVPFMVTQGMKQQLRELGFGEEEIREMTPEEAWGHIMGDTTGAPMAGPADNHPAQPPRTGPLHSGPGAVRGGLECPEVPRSTPHGAERGSSSQGRADGQGSPEDELARLKSQLG